ncbi:hypothetical protein [Winogradskyella flava]|uniref:hypothetical protein n=1 Tax=Winogradskyella flava TaxID=1884876 RepID=UPI00248F9C91|nr:hypothetical protein [Winogradskyella flava]
MKKTKHLVLVAICMAFVTISHAQRYAIKNGIGLQGGITQFDIVTDNFNTQSNSGFLGGMSASVDLPHKWYEVSYNIQLSENNIDILAETPATSREEYVEYKMMAAQLSFLFHVKLIKDNFTLDLGPMLQYNSELELKNDSKEGYLITNYDNLFTEDISGISRFNVNGAVGLSAGINAFQLRAQYIYGFTNILGKLNDNDFNLNNADRFEGNQSLLVLSAILTF